MLRRLNHLDGDIIPHCQRKVRRHPYLRQAELSAILAVVWASDLEGRNYRVGVVRRCGFPLFRDANIDVEESFRMSWEPTRLYRYRTSTIWPLCSVRGHRHTAAYLHCQRSCFLNLYVRYNLQGYIHCMPYGKAIVPLLSKSIPKVFAFSSGEVPFVCRLFPLQPGYVITVCALASPSRAATMTSNIDVKPAIFALRGL